MWKRGCITAGICCLALGAILAPAAGRQSQGEGDRAKYLTESFEDPGSYQQLVAYQGGCITTGGRLTNPNEPDGRYLPDVKEGAANFNLEFGPSVSDTNHETGALIAFSKIEGVPQNPDDFFELPFGGGLGTKLSIRYRFSKADNLESASLSSLTGENPGSCGYQSPDGIQFFENETDLDTSVSGSWQDTSLDVTSRELRRTPRELHSGMVLKIKPIDPKQPINLSFGLDAVEVEGKDIGGSLGVAAAREDARARRRQLEAERSEIVDKLKLLLVRASKYSNANLPKTIDPAWRDYASAYRDGLAYQVRELACTTYLPKANYGSSANHLITNIYGVNKSDINCSDPNQAITPDLLDKADFWDVAPGNFGSHNFVELLSRNAHLLERLLESYRSLSSAKPGSQMISFSIAEPVIDYPLTGVAPFEDKYGPLKYLLERDLVPGLAEAPLELKGAPGEDVDGAVAVLPKVKLGDVSLSASTLRSGNESITASKVDIRVVKSWCQVDPGNVWNPDPYYPKVYGMKFGGNGYLVNELKLFDSELFQTDITGEPGNLSCKNSIRPNRENNRLTDAKKLLPVPELKPNEPQAWWVKVSLPQDAKPGNYSGTLTVSSANPDLDNEIPLEIEVYPFQLKPSPLTYSLYADWQRVQDGSLSQPEQIESNSKLLHQYGLCAPFEPPFASTLRSPNLVAEKINSWLIKAKDWWEPIVETQGQMCNPHLGHTTGQLAYYFKGNAINEGTASKDADIIVSAVQGAVGPDSPNHTTYGFGGIDEPSEADVEHQKPLLEAIKAAGGRNFVTVEFSSQDLFERFWDLFGFGIYGNTGKGLSIDEFYPELADRLARGWQGKQGAYMYNSPQCGLERPEMYRYNYGFNLYKYGFRGIHCYSYQRIEGLAWNDGVECLAPDQSGNCPKGDYSSFREHAMAYPTPGGGSIPTLEIEGLGAAVEDVQYLKTLLSVYGLDKSPNQLSQIEALRQRFGSAQFFGDLAATREWMADEIVKTLDLGNGDGKGEENADQATSSAPSAAVEPTSGDSSNIDSSPIRLIINNRSASNSPISRQTYKQLLKKGFIFEVTGDWERPTASLTRRRRGHCYSVLAPKKRTSCNKAVGTAQLVQHSNDLSRYRYRPFKAGSRALKRSLRKPGFGRGDYQLKVKLNDGKRSEIKAIHLRVR